MSKRCPVCDREYPDTAVFCPTDGATLLAVAGGEALTGTVIADRYVIERVLGEGGMGTVYLGRHVRLPQQVAIKVMRPALLTDSAAVARFTREAGNASRIEHERVARVYDFGETADKRVYLAMEYIRGRTLKALLAEEGPLPLARTAALVGQVADGLDEAHRLGIVHRDLKPDNIMVVAGPNGEDRCKIVDFGIAKAIAGAPGGEDGKLTRTGYVVGTPEYMSPEQLLGVDADHRTDVYALALVAYQCLTQSLPFDTATPGRGMTQRLLGQVRPLQEHLPDIHWGPAVEAALAAALAVEVEQRTPRCGAFAAALYAAAGLAPSAEASPQSGSSTPWPAPSVGAPAWGAPPTPAPVGTPASAPVSTPASAPVSTPAAAPTPRYTTTPPPTASSASLVRRQMRIRQYQRLGWGVVRWTLRLLLVVAVASWFTRPAGTSPLDLAAQALTHPVTWVRQTFYAVVDQDRNGTITPVDYEVGVARIKAWAQDSTSSGAAAPDATPPPPAASPTGDRRGSRR